MKPSAAARDLPTTGAPGLVLLGLGPGDPGLIGNQRGVADAHTGDVGDGVERACRETTDGDAEMAEAGVGHGGFGDECNWLIG